MTSTIATSEGKKREEKKRKEKKKNATVRTNASIRILFIKKKEKKARTYMTLKEGTGKTRSLLPAKFA